MEKAQYAIMRFAKYKGPEIGNIEAHNERTKEKYASNPDVDTSRSKYNFHLVKPPGKYRAESERLNEEVFQAITNHTAKKGDVLGIARIAGIMGAKKNSELIPLCHIIALTDCEISFELDEKHRQIKATCKTSCIGKTGVEMEAM